MKRRFIIATELLDAQQSASVREYLSNNGNWWHWIQNFWLFTTEESEINCQAIRDSVKPFIGGGRLLVMEVPEDRDWATFGTSNEKGDSMTKWLRDTWAGDD